MRIRGIAGTGLAVWIAAACGGLPAVAQVPALPGMAAPGASAQPSAAPPPAALPALGQAAGSVQGGVPQGTPTAQPIALSLDDAIQRGLRYNLAALLASSEGEQARAQRLQALSALLPQVAASASQSRQVINLAAYGISIPGIPQIIGPFNVFAAQLTGSESLNLAGLENTRAARSLTTAAEQDIASTRNLVVVAVANQYLLTIADASQVDAAQAELTTAEQSLTQAQDMFHSGTTDELEPVRAEVERDRERQNLLAAQDALAKQRLALARAIGLPPGQDFTLADTVPYATLPAMQPAAAVAEALATRPDYRAAQAMLRAAQLRLAAARAARLPSLNLTGSWGTLGHELDSNHGVYSVAAGVSMPLFAGGSIRGEIVQAEAQVRDSSNRLDDLRAAIDNQVRDALLDLGSSDAQVQVARAARDLAQQELGMSQDRFRAGVTDNLEVVEAQQSVAQAAQAYIQSLYNYNLAKATLAQALGIAETSYRQYLLSH